MSGSYLYKDILKWEGIKKPGKIVKLLQAVAFHLGSEVSYNNLGSLVQLDNQTVEKYIQLEDFPTSLSGSEVLYWLNISVRTLRNYRNPASILKMVIFADEWNRFPHFLIPKSPQEI